MLRFSKKQSGNVAFAVLLLIAGTISFLVAQPTTFRQKLGLFADSFLSGLISAQPASATAFTPMLPAGASIDLEQCHNYDSQAGVVVNCSDPFPGGSTNWGSGNAQQANALLHEGDNQNFRAIMKNIPNGTYTLNIELDLTKGGEMAYDRYSSPGRLMTAVDPNGATKAGPGVTPESLGIFPCQNNNNANAFCTAGTGVPIQIPAYPAGLFGTSGTSALRADILNSQTNDIPEYMFLYGNGSLTVLSSGYSFSGDLTGDSSVQLSMTIQKSGGTGGLVLAWGGHVSKEPDYSISGTSTASDISGSPYHMRLKSFSALQGDPGNQDMQMASNAIVAAPGLTVTKSPSVSNVCNGSNTPVTYTYVVTNTGNVSLTVNLVDDKLGDVDGGSGVTLAANGGTATFTASTTIGATTTNTVTATGVATGGETATATATATVTGRDCTLSLTKTPSVSSVCNNSNSQVTYTYVVTNTGSFFSVSGSISDDKLGSIGSFGPLAPGASQTLTKVGTVNSSTTNIGTATGTFTDSSGTSATATATATVTTHACGISLTKSPSVTDVCNGSNAQVTYTYVVKNDSDTFNASGTITDNVLGTVGNFGPLAPGASQTLTKVGTINGTTTNTGTANATFDDPASTTATATASATVTGHNCTISVNKVPSSTGPICNGGSVTYAYSVTNNSDIFSWTGTLVDSILGTIGTVTLAPGETKNFAASGTINGVVTNTVLASGTFNDSVSSSATANATATVSGVDCKIIVKKVTNPSGSSQSFEFDPSYSATNFFLTDGQSNDSGNLQPGTYSVAEVNLANGWTLTSATCDDGSPVNAISLGVGEVITCTFTNTFSHVQLTPTGTTCTDFSTGTAADQNQILYGRKSGVIAEVNPGVFLYWVEITAPSSSFNLQVTQSGVTTSGTPTTPPLFLLANDGPKLFDAGCIRISTVTIVPAEGGQTNVNVSGATAGAKYFFTVKYDSTSISGTPVSGNPNPFAATYSYATLINGSQTAVDSLDLVKK